jgi:foldase protein PrsA
MRIKITVLIFLSFFFLINCENKQKTVLKTDNKSQEQTEKKVKRKPFMEINGEPFYLENILNFANFMLSEIDIKTLNNPEIKDKILNDFIKNQVLKQEAIKNNIKIDKKKLENILKNFKTMTDNESIGNFQHIINSEQFKKNIETQMLIQKLIETKVTNKIQIKEDELKKYYNEIIKKYPRKKLYHVFHIVTKSKNQAIIARKMLRKRNAFVKVAKKYSTGPAKDKGGDLGYIDLKNYPEVFQNVKKLRIGKISNVIKSEYGYHIFKLKNIKYLKRPAFEEISGQLYADLYAKKQDKIITEYIKELVDNAKIRIYGNFIVSSVNTDNTSKNNR